MLRVMMCEDSPGDAAALRQLLEYGGEISVVGCGADAAAVIARLGGGGIDLVVVDIRLRATNGLELVEEVMSVRPAPVLVLLPDGGGTDGGAAALAAGALEAVAMSAVIAADPGSRAGAAFRDRVRLLARARVIRHPRARLRRHQGLLGHLPGRGRGAAAIGICASTGGPKILAKLLAALPADYPIPLLVVQHISAGFTPGLVSWLGLGARVPVSTAVNGAVPGPGAWIAPEGANLRLNAAGRLELNRPAAGARAAIGPHVPSGDELLSSIAAAAGRAGVAVVLTGMGRDGARGAAAVRLAGGLTIAQDEGSSPVFGMPRAAADTGVDLVLSPDQIIGCLLRLRCQPLAGAP